MEEDATSLPGGGAGGGAGSGQGRGKITELAVFVAPQDLTQDFTAHEVYHP